MTESQLITLVLLHGKQNGLNTDRAKDVAAMFFLNRDTENPRPDRRSPRSFHKRPTWPRGTRFRVIVRQWTASNDPTDPPCEERGLSQLMGCYRPGARFSMLEWSEMGQEQRVALIENLSLAESETLAESFERIVGYGSADYDACSLLVWAVGKGEMGKEHAERILAGYTASFDDEEADTPETVDPGDGDDQGLEGNRDGERFNPGA